MQPIDLQAIFSQMDKVGKNQASLREGLQIQEALQQQQSQKKLEENVQSVNQAQEMGQEAEKIKDDGKRNPTPGGNRKNPREENEENELKAEVDKPELIRDPALGRNIDISG